MNDERRRAANVLLGVLLLALALAWQAKTATAQESVTRLGVDPWPVTGTDITNGRTPTCSGSTTFSGSCAATNDGNEATGWTPTNTNNTAIVAIDFGSVKNLRYVYVAGRNELGTKVQSVATSLDCTTYTALYLIEDDPPSHQALIDIGTVRTAKCVRVRIEHGAVYEIHAYEDGAIPTTTTTTAPTTTTTAPTTTTTSPATSTDAYGCPDAGGTVDRVECFRPDKQPFWVTVPAEVDRDGWQAPSWSSTAGNIFSITGPLGNEDWSKGLLVGFIPSVSNPSMTINATGFDGSAGCEVWSGPAPDDLTWSGQKQRSGPGTVRFSDLTPGIVYYVALAHDGGSGDSGSLCSLDNIARVSDRTLTGTISTWTPGSSSDPDTDLTENGPGSTGHDGLDDCIPSGWSLLNPFAYVGAIGCALEWAFVPNVDTWNVDDLTELAQERVPFSWLSAVVDGGEELATGLAYDGPGICWNDLGYSEFYEDRFQVGDGATYDGGEWDAQWHTSNCTGFNQAPSGEVTHDAAPIVRNLFIVIIWLALAARLLATAPWSKGRDGGEPA